MKKNNKLNIRNQVSFEESRPSIHGKKPRHLITDKGSQFTAHEFRKYCKRKKIKQRFGAIGKYGSIAVIERFIRSMKDECTRHIFILLKTDEMAFEHNIYVACPPEFKRRRI